MYNHIFIYLLISLIESKSENHDIKTHSPSQDSMFFKREFKAPQVFNNNVHNIISKKDDDDIITLEYNVTMPDNISLYGKAIRPKKEGKYPVILMRIPYVMYEPIIYRAYGHSFASNDYILFAVYVRGSVKSPGEWLPFENDRKDGYSVIEWITKQDWCDGNIGTFGASYVGFTQWCIADYEHPSLKAMFVTNYGGVPYDIFYRRGLFREMIWTEWAATMMGDNRYKMYTPTEQWDLEQFIFYNVSIQVNLGEELIGEPCNWYKNWVTDSKPNGNYWGTGFWKEMSQVPENVKVPIFFHAGWFDVFVRSGIEGYRLLPENIREKSRVLIGPWSHSGLRCGSLKYPGADEMDPIQMQSAIQWFDHYLKGKEYPKKLGVVEAYNIGENKWITWDKDLQSNKKLTFYLEKNENKVAHSLVPNTPSNEQVISYDYDPNEPIKSLGGNMITSNWVPDSDPECCTPQLDPGNRSDIISFISETLGKDQMINGAFEVHLFVSSSANATSFAIKVMEVFESGVSINIVDDITDIRWVDETRIENYTPGTVRELTYKMLDVSWKVAANSKIRIDVSSSNYPLYHVHPNTDAIWSETDVKIVAHQSIFAGMNYPSRIILPIMENNEDHNNNNNKKAVIIAAIVVVLVVVVTITIAVLCVIKKKKNNQKNLYQNSLIESNQ